MADYNFEDPCPGVDLTSIHPSSTRARSWLARTSESSPKVRQGATKFGGAVFMIEGMEYHHRHFMRSHEGLLKLHSDRAARIQDLLSNQSKSSHPSRSATAEEFLAFEECEHEAIAYLNRMGQFWHFAKNEQKQTLLQRVAELAVFRNKFTAHRSMDYPQGESPTELEWQGSAFGWGKISIGWFFVFQIYDRRKGIQQFHMRDDHPKVMDECLAVLQSICRC